MPRTIHLAPLAACLLAASPLALAQQATDVPTCSRNLGTIAVIEPTGQNWWTGQRLPSPASRVCEMTSGTST